MSRSLNILTNDCLTKKGIEKNNYYFCLKKQSIDFKPGLIVTFHFVDIRIVVDNVERSGILFAIPLCKS